MSRICACDFGSSPWMATRTGRPIDPTPDYDASDELEFGINWFPWILWGVYPPPGNPPQ